MQRSKTHIEANLHTTDKLSTKKTCVCTLQFFGHKFCSVSCDKIFYC